MNQQTPILVNVLAGLLRQRGSGLLNDRRRTLGLLRDKVPNEGRAIRILMTAFDQGVPARLSRGPVSELDIGREVALLSDETGISLDRAREAVETWAVAIAHGETPPAPAPVRTVEALPPAPAPVRTVEALPPAPAPVRDVEALPPTPAPVRAVEALPPAPAPAPVRAVEALAPAPVEREVPASAVPQVQPLPPIASPAPAAVPPAAATHGAGAAAPGPSRSPRAQPVTVRQVLKGPSRPAAPQLQTPPPAASPAATEGREAPEDAAPVAAKPDPVQPLPVQPLSVQPLPVQRLHAPADEQRSPPRPETAPVAAPPKGGRLQKWAGIIVGILALVSGAAKLIGAFSPGSRSAPPAAETSPASPAAPQTTAEGVVVMSPDAWPTYPFVRIKDDPTTLAFYFGILYKGQTYTYYSAVALDDGKTTGSSMLVLLRDKQQVSSGAFTIELYTNSKTQYFTESPGKVPNKYGAPNLCVFLSFNPKADRLDPVASGAAGIYGVDAKGACDLNLSFGHANLKQ